MQIPADLANDIVQSISDALHQEINFMDDQGIIIASTDPQRLKQFHAGALAVIANRGVITVKSDHRYCGTKKGINVPVFFEDDIIGVIGITGEEEEVSMYGKLLQNMTEILIRDAYYRDLRHQKRTNERLMIENILSADFQNLSLFQRESLLQDQPHTVVTAMISDRLEEQQIQKMNQQLESPPFSHCYEKKAVYEQEIILFLQDRQIERICATLQGLQEICPFKIYWGIGTSCTDNRHLANSYEQAKKAAAWGAVKDSSITRYDCMGMGILITHTSQEDVQFFLNSVFHDLKPERVEEIIELLKLYEKHNGSLIHCAEELYIHKNSFHYKLMQIIRQTNLDPRNLHDFQLLKTAAQLYEFHKKL